MSWLKLDSVAILGAVTIAYWLVVIVNAIGIR